jgi:hypothetical protein
MCRIRVDEHLYSAVQHAPFPQRQFRAGIPISQELDDLGDPLSVTGPEPRDVGFVLTEPLHRRMIALVEHYKERIGHGPEFARQRLHLSHGRGARRVLDR